MEPKEKLLNILSRSLERSTFKKLVLSRPKDKSVIRSEAKRIGGENGEQIRLETFYTDGKARQTNISALAAASALCEAFMDQYRQLNLMTTGGDCEAKISKGGKMFVSSAPNEGEATAPEPHNKEKNHILKENVPCDFLEKLGICDKNGRVYDKKQPKFRQINRFLEYVRDISAQLPENELRILDLCCGKSYLSFAVYYSFTKLCGKKVELTGVDLKPDVIQYCSETASELGYDGMNFICADISKLDTKNQLHLVMSLHACDIATDIVLETAVRQRAKVILSTPCCHKELFRHYDKELPGWNALGGLAEQSMLRQKMSEALTDALRCLYLESEGYEVSAVELTDPENTPKNLLIRAVRRNLSENVSKARREEYVRLRDSFYGASGGIR